MMSIYHALPRASLVCSMFLWGSLYAANWSAPVDLYVSFAAENPVVGVSGDGNAFILSRVNDNAITYYEKVVQLIDGVPTNPQSFEPVGQSQEGHSISVNAAGNVAITWREENTVSSNNFVRGALYTNNTWNTPSILSDDLNFDVSYGAPGTYRDSMSNALAAWSGGEASEYYTQSSSYTSSWSSPQNFNLSMPGGFIRSFRLAGSPSGKAVATWFQGNSPVLMAGIYDGSTWSTENLSTDVYTTCMPINSVATDSENNAMILWMDNTESLSTIHLSNGVFSTAQTLYIPNTNESVGEASVTVDNNNHALAVWSIYNSVSGQYTVLASRYSDGIWESPTVLMTSLSGENISSLKVMADSNGNAYALWLKQDTSSNGGVYVCRYDVSNTTWDSEPLLLSSPDVSAQNPDISVNSAGDATVAWSAYVQEAQAIQAVYIKQDMGPEAPSSFIGKAKKKTQKRKKFTFKMEWAPSTSENIASYEIYAHNKRIARVSSDSSLKRSIKLHSKYHFHKGKFTKKYKQRLINRYTIQAVDQNGNKSERKIISIQ